jgi:DNA-binding response OmpR family regulator
MTVLLVTRDLSVVSQVDGAAARVGAIARTVSNEEDAAARCVAEGADLIIVDLGTPSINVTALVEQVKAAVGEPPRIVAFGSHVHVERLAAAREAGCDDVMSRGQFFAQLNAVLRGV